MKLNKYQRDWINKLKSGKTRKAIECLNTRQGAQCCLGVGIMTCGLEKIPTNGTPERQAFNEDLEFFPKTMEKLKLNDYTGLIKLGSVKLEWEEFVGHHRCLINLNDDTNYTHKQIGEFIDANREAVFCGS